jgi:hypothetical protein
MLLRKNNTEPQKKTPSFEALTNGRTDTRFNRLRQMHVSDQTPVTQFIPNDHRPYFNARQNGGAANLRTLDLSARDIFPERVHVFNITA